MATIPTPGSELRHVRKTLTFTGGANNGLLGDNVPVFTGTGRVRMARLHVYCTADLVADPDFTALKLRTAAMGSGYFFYTYAYGVAGDWLYRASSASLNVVWTTTGSDIVASNPTDQFNVDGDVYLAVIDEGGASDLTSGTMVIDAWYYPITDDGALAGDDIDEDLKTNIWSKALSDISSVPAITASAKDALNWLFALARNKRTQTATTETVYKDDGSTSLATSTKSDDGTTYTRGEYS